MEPDLLSRWERAAARAAILSRACDRWPTREQVAESDAACALRDRLAAEIEADATAHNFFAPK